jgi:hypothetical protein
MPPKSELTWAKEEAAKGEISAAPRSLISPSAIDSCITGRLGFDIRAELIWAVSSVGRAAGSPAFRKATCGPGSGVKPLTIRTTLTERGHASKQRRLQTRFLRHAGRQGHWCLPATPSAPRIPAVQRCKQGRRAVALVVVGHRASAALLDGQPRLRAVERLNLAFSSTQRTSALSGGLR